MHKLDLTLYGATSFVGQLTARYLFEQLGAAGKLRWAIAGRSAHKLAALRESLGEAAAQLPIRVADAGDVAALRALCGGTRVVISCVGPYALYGEPLVKACAESGTDYCDLTGEVQWISRMIAGHQRAARRSGARIVHSCGFDSIPSDLGVHFLQSEAVTRFGTPLQRVRMRVFKMKGGFSGGTIASLLNVIKEAARDPALRRELADPYSLCPKTRGKRAAQPEVRFAQFDPLTGGWIAPFVMGAINTRIVQRTNALTRNAYGRDFQYDEAVSTGRGLKGRARAIGMAAGIGAAMLAGALPPARWALERFVLPAPGEGPSPDAQRQGSWDLRFIGTGDDGASLSARVSGDRDPGYGSTAKMLGQAALCLAQDITRRRRPGGFWTPASIFGDALIDRLVGSAGLRFEIV